MNGVTKTVIGILLLASMAIAGQVGSLISIREVPPEEIPAGNCTASTSGYLGIVAPDKSERTDLTGQEVGEYIKKKLAEGYSVALYPQASGKIFVIATCHPPKP